MACIEHALSLFQNQKIDYVSDEFLEVAIQNLKQYPTLKWQFFASADGILTKYPASPRLSARDCYSYYDPRNQ